MSDNPFGEPDDSDRTVIRPAPGGRRATPPPAREQPLQPSPFQEAPPPQARASAFDQAPPPPLAVTIAAGAETIKFGLNPLIMAAAPLLQLLARLRTTFSAPDINDLWERTARQVRQFETTARDGGVQTEPLAQARYALCASIDDVVMNTPWGSTGSWAARSLVATFHRGTVAGEGFFQLLDKLKADPGLNLPVLELMYYCLSLGFLGQYRRPPHRPGEIDRVREDLYTIISRQRQALDPALSPHWEGVKAPYKVARAVVPVWVMGAAAAAVIGGLFAWFSTGLNAASDATLTAMRDAPQATMPAITRTAPVRPPVVVPPSEPERLYTFLKPEIDQGLVKVAGDQSIPIVRIINRGKGIFASGNDRLNPEYVHLMERIGEALKTEKGSVRVVGYTDNQPIRTARFPNNYRLSAARAEAARDLIVKSLGDSGRVTAEGKGDADPLRDNATEPGREENRRIEVVLRRQG